MTKKQRSKKILSGFKIQGSRAEKIAERFLKKKGYLILEKNWCSSLGEIDIIALEPGSFWQKVVFPKVLPHSRVVFVEVKSEKGGGLAAERIDRFKQEKLKKLSRLYLQTRQLNHCFYRIDALIVKIGERKTIIKHIVSAVED